jgi:ferredoxin-NADP reductase
MTTATAPPVISSGAKVHEFTADLVLQRRQSAADGVVTLEFTDPDGGDLPSWEPGAHIDLLLTEELTRQYSLFSDPTDPTVWRVGVLLDPQSRGGSKFVHENLVDGATVRVRGPRNHFQLVQAPAYLFIAGGIGITPIMTMVRAAQQAGADWSLVYLGRSRATMAFAEELEASYGSRVTVWADDEKEALFELGSVLGAPREETLVYCCGPEGLLTAVEQGCSHWPEGSLHIERFAAKAPSPEQAAAALESFAVVCQRSGVTVEVSGEGSILEALEDADIPILSSCLEGVCGTCEATVLEGIPDHRDSMLSDAERASNKVILTCVSRSCSERLVLDL